MPTIFLPNPAEQLGVIVSHLYKFATDGQVAPAHRVALFQEANDLRGDLVALVSMQFSQATAAYTGTMAALADVGFSINQAEHNVQAISAVLDAAARLSISIDDLLKTTALEGDTDTDAK